MSTHIVQIERQRYICGLFWQSLSRRHELAREGVELAKKLNFDLMVLHIDRGVAAAGYANSQEGAQSRLPSLSMLVSKSVAQQGAFYGGRQQPAPNWLGAFRLPDERWAYFAVRDGAFLPNGDAVGTREEVLERLTSDYGLGGWNVVIGDHEIDALGFPNFYPRRIEDMLWRRRGRTVIPGWARLRSVRPRMSWRSAALAAGVAAVLVASLLGYLSYRSHMLSAARERALALARERLALEGARERAAQTAPWRSLPPPPQFTRNCMDAFGLFAPGGWTLQRYVCEAGTVEYLWARNGSTAAMLLADVPQAQLDATGDHATLVQTLARADGPDDVLEPAARVDADLLSRFQLLELALTLTPRPPPAALVPGAGNWHEASLRANFGELSPPTLAGYLDEPGVRLDKLVYQAGKWSAEGVVYAK